jgi:hypothetical protein
MFVRSIRQSIGSARSRVSRRLSLSVRVAAAILGTSAGVLALTGVPAQASLWQLQDGFDYQPAATWTIEHVGTSGGGFDLNAGTARTAPNDAFLWAQTQFSSVGRSVTLRNNSTRTSCAAGIYLQGFDGAKVNVEVIDPSTWTYVALNTVTISGSGYRQYTVGPWTGGPNTVYMRVSLLGTGAYNLIRIDDLTVQCSY